MMASVGKICQYLGKICQFSELIPSRSQVAHTETWMDQR